MIRQWLHDLFVWLATRTAPSVVAVSDPVKDAVRQAFVDVGLPAHLYTEDFDLLKSNKLLAVYVQASRALGRDPAFATVADVIADLKS